MPRAGDASTRDRRLALLLGDRACRLVARGVNDDDTPDTGLDTGLDTEPPSRSFSLPSSDALAAAAAASALNRPVDMGVKGKARAVLDSVAFAFAFAFSRAGSKKGTGPVSQEPSGVVYVPAPSKRGVIIPPGHSLFAAHVSGVGTPGALPRFVPTHAGVEANWGVETTGGGNARSASRASTGVPKPSSWACGAGTRGGQRGENVSRRVWKKRNEDLRFRLK